MQQEIQLGRSLALLVLAQPGGVRLGIRSGPFLQTCAVALADLDKIAQALQAAKVEAERAA